MRAVQLLLALLAVSYVAADWALTDNEISASRGQYTRNGLRAVTHGNTITPLIDGQTYFTTLYNDFENALAGDFIYCSTFHIRPDMMLLPNPSHPDAAAYTRLDNTLVRAIKRGVHVRMLVNVNLYFPTDAISFCHTINQVCQDAYKNDCCVPDSRHNSKSGSLHNKQWIISHSASKELVAYLGSEDVNQGRWDMRNHSGSAERSSEPDEIVPFFGWHGYMYRVTGGAAIDAYTHWVQRWNDPASPFFGYPVEQIPLQTLPEPTTGTLSVQLLRTLSCQGARASNYYSTFAPAGEYSFQSAFYKMVRSAKKYLYLVDQFMFFDEAIKVVAEQLPHIEALIILTDNGATGDYTVMFDWKISWLSDMRFAYQKRAFDMLTADPVQAKKVHIYQLARENHPADGNTMNMVYVHAKLYMADDSYVILGSHGVERAAFTNDIDLSMGISDDSAPAGSPDSWVGQLRRNLWAEHLDIDINDPRLLDPVASVALWDAHADLGTKRLRHYYPKDPGSHWYIDIIYNFYQPEGRCL